MYALTRRVFLYKKDISMSDRTVMCSKFKEEMEGLDKPPFAGDLGVTIFENVSKKAWHAWKDDMELKVINEYRLNMGDRKDYEVLLNQMKLFFNLKT